MNGFENVPVIDLFVGIQGEGMLSGFRHVFVRVSGCNLRCKFKNSICDTAYSSFSPEKGKFSLEDIASLINEDQALNICLTGGEPCLYPDFIKWMKMSFPNKALTIETNGTIFPGEEIARYIDLVSISPKMITTANPDEPGYDRRASLIHGSAETIVMWLESSAKEIQLKYVVADENDVIEAINHLKEIEKVSGQGIQKDFVYLMPAGSSFEELCETRPIVGDLALKYGFSLSDRLQFNFWGSKREA